MEVKGNLLVSGLTVHDATDVILGSSTGTRIGTSTSQKLSFFAATPIAQPASTTDLRQLLINLGLLATGGATPLNLNGGALTAGNATVSSLTNSGVLTAAGATLSSLTVSGSVIQQNQYAFQQTRALPTTINNEVDIGSLYVSNGGMTLNISVVVSDGGFSASKTYTLAIGYGQTSNVWNKVFPADE